MGTSSFPSFVSFFLYAFLLLSNSPNGSVFAEELVASKREALEIIIGGGGGGGDYAPPPPPDSCDCDTPPPPEPICPPPPEPICPPPPPPPPPVSERLRKAQIVLLNFKNLVKQGTILDPKGFTRTWVKDGDTCKYKGIRCDKYPNSNDLAVSGIDFNGAGFASANGNQLSLSGILDGIPELTFYHVNSNNYTGSIPNNITQYRYFYELDLSNNKLTCGFPEEVLLSKNLVFLDLRFNRIYGPLPPKLFEMNLDVIFLNNNEFCQDLPQNFGSTPARYLTFANNKFTGPIPRSIGQASKTLREVLFLGNQFSGCLPFEIGYLKNAIVFDVSKNFLTGPIPLSFACLEKIQILNLGDNQFYGLVPELLCMIPGLRNSGNLTFRNNYFTHVGPQCRKLIEANVLDVSNNCIFGLPNQKSLAQCKYFFSTVKPCPNHGLLTYLPCKNYWSKQQKTEHYPATAATPPALVTYKSLKPHRL